MTETPEPADSDDGGKPEDDVKRRFREALDRKNARAKSGDSHADGSSKIHNSHGPAASRRTFRRKSG
jgi:hypothetical protein